MATSLGKTFGAVAEARLVEDPHAAMLEADGGLGFARARGWEVSGRYSILQCAVFSFD